VRYEFKGIFFTCNEVGHMKRDCKGKAFKHVKDFYCYNYHCIGHKAVDCRNNNNRKSRMFRGTIPIGSNERRISSERTSIERRSNDGERPDGMRN
jgi:hypothetical protein